MTGERGTYVPCMSRHFGNEGRPRPPVEWTVTYACIRRPGRDPLRKPECDEPLVYGACDACATSLVDGKQRCARCLAPMVVTDLTSASRREHAHG